MAKSSFLGGMLELETLSLQLKIDVLTVVAGHRPSGRIFIHPDQIELVAYGLVSQGIEICVGQGMIGQEACTSGFLYSHEANRKNAPIHRYHILYFSRNRDHACATRDADTQQDDKQLGYLLGYPACCVQAVTQQGAVPDMDYYLNQAESLGYYIPLVWPPALLVDSYILNHHPCSILCRDSALASLVNLDLVNRYLPSYLSKIKNANLRPYELNGNLIGVGDLHMIQSPAALMPLTTHEIYNKVLEL